MLQPSIVPSSKILIVTLLLKVSLPLLSSLREINKSLLPVVCLEQPLSRYHKSVSLLKVDKKCYILV